MPVERVTDSMMAIVHALAESYEIVWIEFEFWKQVYWAHVVDFEFFFGMQRKYSVISLRPVSAS